MKNLNLILVLFTLWSNHVFGQAPSTVNGKLVPHSGDLTILILLYAESSPGNIPGTVGNNFQGIRDLIYTDNNQFLPSPATALSPSISEYFYRNSNRNFRVRGLVVPFLLSPSASASATSANRLIIQNYLNTLKATQPELVESLDRYTAPGYQTLAAQGPDGTVDYAFDIIPNGGYSFSGLSAFSTQLRFINSNQDYRLDIGLNGNQELVQVKNGSSVVAGGGIGFFENIFHEFAHANLDYPHTAGANAHPGNQWTTNSYWGLMQFGIANSVIGAYQRWICGWLNLDQAKDLTYGQGANSNTLILKDLASENDAIRISLPGLNQRIWLEYYGENQGNVSEYLYNRAGTFMAGGEPVPVQPPRGLIVYYEGQNGDRAPNLSPFNMVQSNAVRLIPAVPSKDFVGIKPESFTSVSPWWNGNTTPDFITGRANPLCHIDYGSTNARINFPEPNYFFQTTPSNPNFILSREPNHNAEDYSLYSQTPLRNCLPAQSGTNFNIERDKIVLVDGVRTYSYLFQPEAAFENAGTILSLNTNPIPTNMAAFNWPVAGNCDVQGLGESFLRGLKIEILSIQDDQVELKISWGKTDISVDQRLTGNIVVNSDAGNSSASLRVTDGAVVTIDRSETQHRISKNSWDNTFFNPTTLTVNANAKVVIDEGEMKLEDNSGLWLNPACTLTVKEGGKLTIGTGATFHVKAGAVVNVETGGQLEIESGAFVCFESGATYSLGANAVVNIGTFTNGMSAAIRILKNGNATPTCDNSCLLLSGHHVFDLGSNPPYRHTEGCCPASIPNQLNIACATDHNSAHFEDIKYLFRVEKVNGVFPHLRVGNTQSDFATSPVLRYFDGSAWPLITMTTSGNGAYKKLNSSEIPNYANGNDYADFALEIDATVENSAGLFKTFVFTVAPSQLSEEQEFPEVPTTCCRRAVSGSEPGQEVLVPLEPSSLKANLLKLVPNPASGFVHLLWEGGEAEFEVVDALGRVVVSRQALKSSMKLETAHLPSGLFYVKVIGNRFVESRPLQLIR